MPTTWLPRDISSDRPTPAELIRDGLRGLKQHVQSRLNATDFQSLDADKQDRLLHAVEKGDTQLDGIDGKLFFEHFLALAKEGVLADPIYGGNRDMAGWKMVGFPGARGNCYDWRENTISRIPIPPF